MKDLKDLSNYNKEMLFNAVRYYWKNFEKPYFSMEHFFTNRGLSEGAIKAIFSQWDDILTTFNKAPIWLVSERPALVIEDGNVIETRPCCSFVETYREDTIEAKSRVRNIPYDKSVLVSKPDGYLYDSVLTTPVGG